jgi:hypothetical protein
VAKIARRSNAACSPPTATRSPTRCPPKPVFPLSELDRMLAAVRHGPAHSAGSERGRRSSRPSVSSRGTRTILKEPETRRLKNRGHLARNRQFESISLQRRVCKPSVPREIRVAPEHIAGPGSKLGGRRTLPSRVSGAKRPRPVTEIRAHPPPGPGELVSTIDVRWRCCRPGSRNYRRRLLD